MLWERKCVIALKSIETPEMGQFQLTTWRTNGTINPQRFLVSLDYPGTCLKIEKQITCYSPFVISQRFSETERSVKARKQNNHRLLGSDTCSCHYNNVMLQTSGPNVSGKIVSLKLQNTPGSISYFVRCIVSLPCRSMPDELMPFRLN